MFKHGKISDLDEFFTALSAREGRNVYFYRINGYNSQVDNFIKKIYEAARMSGVIIEGKLLNPDEKNLSYYEEIMGLDFKQDKSFIDTSLKKWLPRMSDYQRQSVVDAMYDTLEDMKRHGKNDNILKNAYIKFMCWLYYKFERIVNVLGSDRVPKIVYEGSVSNYELKLLQVLSKAGCDIVLLQYSGDDAYKKLDPTSEISDDYKGQGLTPFPQGYSLKALRDNMRAAQAKEKIYGAAPQYMNCTNAWITGKGFEDFLKGIPLRGNDSNLYYNCFYRINGVEDKLTYVGDIFRLSEEVKNTKRNVLILENKIPVPTTEEINQIHRKNYNSMEQMLGDLVSNIQYPANSQLQRLMVKAFVDIMSGEEKVPGMNVNRMTGKAVYALCWLKRYQAKIFSNWKMPDVEMLIYLGGCKNENEALFIRMIARLPVDVLILNPNINNRCVLQDKMLYEINNTETMNLEHFPTEDTEVRVGTAAYHAERELDTIMYQDSGMYRDKQHDMANVITLNTMYEEIAILWDEELKYRSGFEVIDGVVNIPVIFAKVSGIKDGLLTDYWSSIKKLITEDTIVIKNGPYIDRFENNPVKPFVTEFYKNGRLNKTIIKNHRAYQYSMLRDETQNYILDKLQLLLERKPITGMFENGTEYTVISVVLNMKKEIVRLIQKFDFTKKNPKIIYINTLEESMSLEDSILMAFLNLAGFDIVFYVPTGYQSVEKHFNRKIMEEHQIGEFMYDLTIPSFDKIPLNTRHKWRDKIFKRGS